MAMDLIQRVTEAEHAAEQSRAKAAMEAREIVKAVEEASLARTRQAAVMAREESTHALEEAKAVTQKEIDALARKEEAQRQVLRDAAMARVDDAASLIYERIVHHGNR